MPANLKAVPTPPADITATIGDDRETLERLTIAALCWWNTGADEAANLLDPHDFRHGRWRTCYETIATLRADRRPVDAAELIDELDRTGNLTHIGGTRTILELADTGYPGGSPTILAATLADWARRDRLTATAAHIAEQSRTGSIDVDAALDALDRDAQPDREHGIDRVADVETAARTRIRDGSPARGTPIGWPTLDSLYRPEQGLWTVVTGVAGAGKSTIVDNFAVNLAARHDWRFAMFSPESAPTDRHVTRLVRMLAPTRLADLREDQIDTWLRFVAEHFEWINSTDGLTVEEILRRADVIHRRRPIDGLVVDPWNEIDRPEAGRDPETLRISAAITKIRRWARRRHVHVWVIAHPTKLTRRPDGSYATPTLYDIANSATFRDKADMGLIVDRDQRDPSAPTKLHVAKVRFAEHGRLGIARLSFNPARELFGPEGPL